VPAERLAENPKCGACKAALFDGHPVELGNSDFRTHIERSDLPVVVDFWAPWCGPCRTMAPVFAQVAGELRGRAQLAKVNTEAEPQLAGSFDIRSIPTLMILRDKVLLFSQAGALPEAALEDLIRQVRALDMDEVRRQVAEEEARAAAKDDSLRAASL
jgi:thioredoxin